ncbi:MAG: HDIG domain-containing metalloprotein [Lentisphaeria bacterium]
MKVKELFRWRFRGPAGRVEAGMPWRDILLRVVLVALVGATAATVLLLRPQRRLLPFVEGQVADRAIFAEVSFEYENAEQTARLKRDAVLREAPVFRVDRSRVQESLRRLQAAAELAAPPAPGAPPATAGVPASAELPALTPGRRAALEYLATSPVKWKYLQKQVTETVSCGLAGEGDAAGHFNGRVAGKRFHLVDEAGRKRLLTLDSVDTPMLATRRIGDEFLKAYPDNNDAAQDLLQALLPHVLLANIQFDPEATHRMQAQAAAAVRPVRCLVQAGEPLLLPGERVASDSLVRLEKHQDTLSKRQGETPSWAGNLFQSLLFLVLLLVAVHCLHAIHPEAVAVNANVALIAVVVILQLVLNRTAAGLYGAYGEGNQALLPAVLPLSFGAMLLAELIGLRVALWCGILTSLVAALQFDLSLPLLLTGTVASFVAGVLMRRARRRYHALRAGLGVGVLVSFMTVIFLVPSAVPRELLVRIMEYGMVIGLITAVIAAAVTPFFEYVFGVTTDLSLLELSDLNHPLLKRLRVEAPGTYHHSLTVATVAEDAASAIHANPLLARVCAYFHDIGKLENPNYFTENAMGTDPHQDLQPTMSSLVILNHVKAGLEFASHYKLQPPIREAIATHHGTSLVYYFFRRAKARQGAEAAGGQEVGEQEFRYPGPLPRRKEIIIVSIADLCEAATRSLEKPTAQRIRSVIEELLLKRIEDGQFDAADLTFEELATVRETIIHTLTTMLHSRIRYPKDDEDVEEDAHDSDPDQPADTASRGAQPRHPAAPAAAGGNA